jgi:hypothetical protein
MEGEDAAAMEERVREKVGGPLMTAETVDASARVAIDGKVASLTLSCCRTTSQASGTCGPILELTKGCNRIVLCFGMCRDLYVTNIFPARYGKLALLRGISFMIL